jgi:tetratricopeptide (TPR) repeat protein
VQAKRPELVANLEWLLANNRGEDALRFVVPFAYFLSAGNQQTQAYEFLTRVLELPAAQAASAIRARALYDAGLLAFRQRDQAKSRALNDESLRVAREIGDETEAATALIGLSRIALRAHEYKTVYALAQEAAEVREKLGDQSGRISAMHMVAAAARMEGNDARAQQIYEATLKNYRAQGEKRRAAGELFNLGYVYLHQNDVTKALEHFRDALQDYRALQDKAGISYCLTGFAAVAAVKKERVRAAQLYGAASAMLERLHITLDPDDQLDWDRYSEAARKQFENGRYEIEYAQGQTLTEDGAIKLAQSGE